MVEALDAHDSPEDIVPLVSRSATTTLGGALSSSKTSVLPAKAIAHGRGLAFGRIREKIVSYTYFNSSPSAAICKHMAGKNLVSQGC